MNNLYVSSQLTDGLGNNLFQIAASYGIACRDNKVPVFVNDNTYKMHSKISDYYDNIFRNLLFTNKLTNFISYRELDFSYNKIPNIKSNLMLFGWFQSEKYFENCKDEIRDIFSMNDSIKNSLYSKYSYYLNKPTCSIHIRRGDYLKSNGNHPVQDINYYKNSVSYFNNEMIYFIFSDDIDWCENNFNFLKKKIIITDNKDYEDLYLMSLCKNNIIANSTFSWWGAWLNQFKNKKTLAPKKWFGANKNNNTKDLYCKDWILI